MPRLDYLYGGFNYRIPTPGVENRDGRLYANVQFPGLEIRYTTDGSEPEADSPLYVEPLDATGTVIFRVFNKKGRGSSAIRVVN